MMQGVAQLINQQIQAAISNARQGTQSPAPSDDAQQARPQAQAQPGEPLRHYLKTGPDPIAMVIRVELFIHKPYRQKPPVT